ncbi:MAG: YitT family protein [Clostridiaceae bacterium]|nr:YitT family protein [Clostridiaceae bacterium]
MELLKSGRQAAFVRRILLLSCGAAILAFGLFNIHSQSHITEGGVLGMTLLLQHWLHLSPGVTAPVLDIACYLLGLRVLGAGFLGWALAGSAAFSAFYNLYERFGYVLPDLGGRPLLAAVLGGLFVGIGVGMIVRAGGASGGDDALALAIAKAIKCPLSRAYLATDLTVLLLSVSYIPLRKIACSLVTVTISSFCIDWLSRSTGKQ